MKVLNFFILLIMLIPAVSAQKVFKEKNTHVVSFTNEDTEVEAEILTQDKKVNINSDITYTWYKDYAVKTTKGGYDGKLLNGRFIERYANGNLKTKGSYRYGMKYGKWTTWHLEGTLEEVSHWKEGKLHGSVQKYHKDETLAGKTSYKNGQELTQTKMPFYKKIFSSSKKKNNHSSNMKQ